MNSERQPASSSLRTLCFLCVSALSFVLAIRASSNPPAKVPQESAPFRGQSQEEADRKSSGCVSCHTSTDEPTMHPTKTVHLGCTDCHGGNSSISIAPSAALNSPEYNSAKEKAHVQPRDPSFRNRSALPERTYTKWLGESAEYIKFVNPGDLRVRHIRLSRRRNPRRLHQHDDSRWNALGRSALQQRRLSGKKHALR